MIRTNASPPEFPAVSQALLSILEGGLDNLHSLTCRMAGGALALIFLDEATRRVVEVVVLGKISGARCENGTLYIDPSNIMARAAYGTVHHELGRLHAWTGSGRACMLIVDLSNSMDDVIGPWRMCVPMGAFQDLRPEDER